MTWKRSFQLINIQHYLSLYMPRISFSNFENVNFQSYWNNQVKYSSVRKSPISPRSKVWNKINTNLWQRRGTYLRNQISAFSSNSSIVYPRWSTTSQKDLESDSYYVKKIMEKHERKNRIRPFWSFNSNFTTLLGQEQINVLASRRLKLGFGAWSIQEDAFGE